MGQVKICFVCLGNICRSPMAEAVMKNMVPDWEIESRATSTWEHGNPIHSGTQELLKKYQIPYDLSKTSQQMSHEDFEKFDYILAMDEDNVSDLYKMSPREQIQKIHLFDIESIPDPWYTGDFEDTYKRVSRACKSWIARLLD